MQRHEHHAWISVEDVLRPVAVVNVEIDHRDAIEAVLLERVHRADGRGLLAGREVAVAADASGLVLALGLGLEDPAEDHFLV